MPRKLLILILALGLIFALSASAFAQVDDDDDDDNDTMGDDDDATGDDFFSSTVVFTEPAVLDPEAELLFEINVTNNAQVGADKGDWVNQVDLTMPSTAYLVDEETLAGPAPLHGATGDDTEIDKWEASFDPTTATITWATLTVVSSANYGDIREGESLAFEFTATTDADASDGFDWVLYSDEGPIVTGTAYVEAQGDDDTGDDDDTAGDDDDDDDDDSGCGC
jgi:hypothetical protein